MVIKIYYLLAATIVLAFWGFSSVVTLKLNIQDGEFRVVTFLFFAVPCAGFLCTLGVATNIKIARDMFALFLLLAFLIHVLSLTTAIHRNPHDFRISDEVIRFAAQFIFVVLAHVALLVRTSPFFRPQVTPIKVHSDEDVAHMRDGQVQTIVENEMRMDPEELEW